MGVELILQVMSETMRKCHVGRECSVWSMAFGAANRDGFGGVGGNGHRDGFACVLHLLLRCHEVAEAAEF